MCCVGLPGVLRVIQWLKTTSLKPGSLISYSVLYNSVCHRELHCSINCYHLIQVQVKLTSKSRMWWWKTAVLFHVKSCLEKSRHSPSLSSQVFTHTTSRLHFSISLLLSISIISDKDYNSLNQSACGDIGSDCIPFPNEKFQNMCNCPGCKLSPPCPFKADTQYNITVPVPLQTSFPKVR